MDPTIGLAIFGMVCAAIMGFVIIHVFCIGIRQVSGYTTF